MNHTPDHAQALWVLQPVSGGYLDNCICSSAAGIFYWVSRPLYARRYVGYVWCVVQELTRKVGNSGLESRRCQYQICANKRQDTLRRGDLLRIHLALQAHLPFHPLQPLPPRLTQRRRQWQRSIRCLAITRFFPTTPVSL